MSILTNPGQAVDDASGQSKPRVTPAPATNRWRSFFEGMGSVLELMPHGDLYRPKDADEALLADLEKVHGDFCVAFERLASQHRDEESSEMPPGPTKPPLPSPEVLERYKRIIPDYAERLLGAWEEESKHRRRMEAQALEMYFAERRLGQIFGFAIGLVAVLAGSVTASLGAEWAGFGIGGGGVVGLVSVFVLGKRNK